MQPLNLAEYAERAREVLDPMTWGYYASGADDERTLADNAAAQGKRWLEGMQQIADGDDRVSNVRGQGLIMAFDMPDGAQRNALLHKMMKHGLIGLSSGDRTVRFRPHLAITDADTDKCLELTAESLKAL